MKVFRVIGEIRKPNLNTTFKKDVVADRSDHAVEKIYAEIGSRHRAKRFHISITSVEEIPPEQMAGAQLKRIGGDEKIDEQK